MPAKKVPISFRVDPDVLEFFRRGGEGYQSRMNAVLRGYVLGRTRQLPPDAAEKSRRRDYT